jgi:hypothetical protein
MYPVPGLGFYGIAGAVYTIELIVSEVCINLMSGRV